METYDYGIMGEERFGTDFQCVITDIYPDGSVMVKDEEGYDIVIDLPRFRKEGNLLDESQCKARGFNFTKVVH